ncbi:uncharacterized protein LOC131953336 [Physella acuta]|uniref:uncharacterized protein LOC131953336 n=1 Tax=Physella acuta TaxID=109671 RepID=UPI0027DC9725|nr:uncharacterized protein LOC131953336 [Physella acuta]XP_059172468.1 uncharacterized protein LOC131953336 [Physella acuta]XP_059172469.1 uncharacterized protein LOC131953336 [Physella acuta]XP_059172470.1 uncharacterized protein LOC131953336 [Physella acuta]
MEGSFSKDNDLAEVKPFDVAGPSTAEIVLKEEILPADIEMVAAEELVTAPQPLEHNYSKMKLKTHHIEIGTYDKLINCYSEPTEPLLNGYIARSVQHCTMKNLTFVCSKDMAEKQGLTNANSELIQKFYSAVSKLMREINHLKKDTITNWNKIVELLNKPFTSKDEVITTVMPNGEIHTNNLEIIKVHKLPTKELSLSKEDRPSVAREVKIHTSPFIVKSLIKPKVSPSVFTDEQMTPVEESGNGLTIKTNCCSRCHVTGQELLKSRKTIKELQEKCRTLQVPRIERMQKELENKCYKSNQALLQSRKKIIELRATIRSLQSPRIGHLQEALKKKSMQAAKLKSELKTISTTEKEKGELALAATRQELRLLRVVHTKLQKKLQTFTETNNQNVLLLANKLKLCQNENDDLKRENKKLAEENRALNDKLSTELIFAI